MTEPHTYNKVHIAAEGQTEEATYHMDMDKPTKGFPVKSRVISIASVDDIEAALSKLSNEKFEIDYLDFHAHGYGGAVFVDSYSKLQVEELRRFRNRGFDRLFRADAIISFMSCKVADVDLGSGEDGELFLAEIASTFLGHRGGSVLGRNKDWKYKPPIGYGFLPPIGPFTATFKNEGAQIAAEISANSTEPVLRGHFRLDKARITQEVSVVSAIVNWAITVLNLDDLSTGKSLAPPKRTGNPVDDLVANTLYTSRNLESLKKYSSKTKSLEILNRCLKSLKDATDLLRAFGQLYLRLHKAASIIDDQINVLIKMSIPILDALPQILSAIRSTPLKT